MGQELETAIGPAKTKLTNTGATLDERMVLFETAVHDQDVRLTPLEQVMAADAVNTTPLMDFAQKIAEIQSKTDSLKRKTTRSSSFILRKDA